MDTSVWSQMLGEFIGTLVLVLMGDGVVAANLLRKSKSEDSGWITIALGWGAAVTLGIYASSFFKFSSSKSCSISGDGSSRKI